MSLVYEVTHKYVNIYEGDGYLPLMVGAYNKEVPEGYASDNIGDNISDKNDAYCELTGLYWIWKNCEDKLVGLVHYRRFFGEYKKGIKIRDHYFVISKKKAYKIFNLNELIIRLGNKDLLVKERLLKHSNLEDFKKVIGDNICNDVFSALNNLYPEYIEVYLQEMKSYSHFNCNMFFGKKEIIDRYCEWLFSVLTELEVIYFNRTSERYHNRELGYVGEMLFKVWIKYNKIEYKITPVISYPELCNPLEYLILIYNTFKIWRNDVFFKKKMQKYIRSIFK